VVVDISNRPFLAYRVNPKDGLAGTFDINLFREFYRALVNNSGITLHVDLFAGKDAHHIAESIFKAFGRALDQALGTENRLGGRVPSTKETL
jgi:imidazoleglycerol-phosphate dehydratase